MKGGNTATAPFIDGTLIDQGSTITLTGPVDGHFPNQSLYSYDAVGDTIAMTDQNDTTHAYTYDALGRMVTDAVTLAPGNPKNVDESVLRIETSYNDAGLVYQTTSYDAASGGDIVNQVQDMYNGFGQLITEYQSASGAVDTETTLSVQYAYGAAATGSRLISMTNPNGTEVDYTYGPSNSLNDVIGRLQKITESGVTLQSYAYLGVSTVVTQTDVQSGLVLTYQKLFSGDPNGDAGDQYTGLDRFGRVVEQYWYLGATDNPVEDYQYTYDRDGNVTAKNNLVYDAAMSQTIGEGDLDETYTYDDLGQLAEVKRDGALYQSFDMDSVGNITSVTNTGGTTDRVSNAQNELVSDGDNTLAYDNNGNTTTDAAGDTLTYDAWNRLVAVYSGDTLIESYTYDGMGRRITEYDGTTTTNLYYSTQDQVLEENQGGYAIVQNVWSAMYVNALVLRDSDSNPADGTHTLDTRTFVTQDANFNVTGMVTLSGDTWSMDIRAVYDGYGNATFYASDYSSTTTNTLGMRTLYQGMFYDAATGLYRADARDYDPGTMTWLEPDPTGFPDGADRDAFVSDNPTNGVDPTGLRNYFTLGLGLFLPEAADRWLNGGGASSPPAAPTPGPVPSSSTPSGGGSGTYATMGTHFTNPADAAAMQEQESGVSSNVMPGLPNEAEDIPLFDVNVKDLIEKKLAGNTVNLPISFELFSKNFYLGDVPAFTELTASLSGGVSGKEEKTCANISVVLELGIYIGQEYGESGDPKPLYEKGENFKAKAVNTETVAKQGEEPETNGWKINGKAFASGGIGKFSVGLEGDVALGTLDFEKGLKLHIPDLSDVSIKSTTGNGTAVGIGFSAEQEFPLSKIEA